jgi:spermidine synthase
VEHFKAVQARLAPGGVFCQWLPQHQLDLETLRSIVQSYLAVFPGGWAMLATHSLDTPVVGLVARAGPGHFDLAALRGRLATVSMPRPPSDFGITDEFALLGAFVAGPAALARFAGPAPANTDDRPVVAYRSPRATYAPESLPRDRLMALLHELRIEPSELVGPPIDPPWAARMAAYWTARTRFIEAGRRVQPSADPVRMLEQVREPLLSVLHTSADFRPAYDPLLRLALALARAGSPMARPLLEQLSAAQPARPEAAEALDDDRLRGRNGRWQSSSSDPSP